MRKLIAALACRNGGSRLYGKPLQNLDVENRVSVLQHMVDLLRTIDVVDGIVLGIAEGVGNLSYIDFARKNGLSYIIGDEKDVLGRLVQCGERERATDILRLTTESPFPYYEGIQEAWKKHVSENYDMSCLDEVPVGSGFEIIRLETLKYAHTHGEDRHRSEFCSLFIRENKDKFRIDYVERPKVIERTDIRLAIDYPEDLILCRAVYANFKDLSPRVPLADIIHFLDQNPKLNTIIDPFVEEGLKTMNL